MGDTEKRKGDYIFCLDEENFFSLKKRCCVFGKLSKIIFKKYDTSLVRVHESKN